MSWKEFQKTGTIGQEDKQVLSLLIVDDERGILNTLEESFRDMFKVYTANSGTEALQIFRANEIQLVLSDQRMPEMTGVELFGKLKEINPTPVRILITGYSDINVDARHGQRRRQQRPHHQQRLFDRKHTGCRRYPQLRR